MRSAECGVRNDRHSSFVIGHLQRQQTGRRDGEKHCGVRSADCGLKRKNPNPSAGGGRDPGAESRGTRKLPKRQAAADGRESGFGIRDSARARGHPPRRAVLRRLPAALPPRKRRVDRGLYNILHERDHDLILLAPEGHTDL